MTAKVLIWEGILENGSIFTTMPKEIIKYYNPKTATVIENHCRFEEFMDRYEIHVESSYNTDIEVFDNRYNGILDLRKNTVSATSSKSSIVVISKDTYDHAIYRVSQPELDFNNKEFPIYVKIFGVYETSQNIYSNYINSDDRFYLIYNKNHNCLSFSDSKEFNKNLHIIDLSKELSKFSDIKVQFSADNKFIMHRINITNSIIRHASSNHYDYIHTYNIENFDIENDCLKATDITFQPEKQECEIQVTVTGYLFDTEETSKEFKDYYNFFTDEYLKEGISLEKVRI